jgi:hypothetical protein
MANNVTVYATLQFANPTVSSKNLGITGAIFTTTAADYSQNSMSVPTTAGGTVIPIGNLVAPGFYAIFNHDSTNYVTLLDAHAGNVICQIQPGMCAIGYFPATITAPALIAHTGACDVEWVITGI